MNFRIFVVILIAGGLTLISAGENSSKRRVLSTQLLNMMPDGAYQYAFLPRKDTVFISGDEYISICLKTQTATLNRRNDSNLVFPISSGNENIEKGIKTTPGIFTVQSKIRLGISKQFNDAELINWIGFNGNIGFHALKGNGYYYTLGKRPSSHGCVRISREDSDTLYQYVKVGTPVIVYDETPARILAFLNDIYKHTQFKILSDNINLKTDISSRLENLYSGFGNLDFGENIYLEEGTILKKLKIPVGDATKISGKQKYVANKSLYNTHQIDKTNIYMTYFSKISDKNQSEIQ